MRKSILGTSGLEVSRIAFGTSQLGDGWRPTDESSAVAATRRAVDGGVTFFDTDQTRGAGAAERLLSTALRGVKREDLVIASGSGLRPDVGGLFRDSSAKGLRQGVEHSLRVLDTSYIDLYQLRQDPVTPIEESAAGLAELIAEGKIRYVGVSDFDVAQMDALRALLPVESLQPRYHLFRREIEAAILPYAAEHDMGVVVSAPLAHGLLGGGLTPATRFAASDWRASSEMFRGETFARDLAVVEALRTFARKDLGLTLGQLAIAWVLANPAVQTAIVSTRSTAHVDDVLVAEEVDLSQDEIWAIEDLVTSRREPSGADLGVRMSEDR